MSAGQCGGEEPAGAGREAGGRILFSPGDSQRQQSLPLTRASRTLEVREGGGKQPASGGGSSDMESEDAAAGFQPRQRTKSLRGLVLLSHRLPGVEGAGERQVGLLRPGRPAWPRGGLFRRDYGIVDNGSVGCVASAAVPAACVGIEAEVGCEPWKEGGNEEAPTPQPRLRFRPQA